MRAEIWLLRPRPAWNVIWRSVPDALVGDQGEPGVAAGGACGSRGAGDLYGGARARTGRSTGRPYAVVAARLGCRVGGGGCSDGSGAGKLAGAEGGNPATAGNRCDSPCSGCAGFAGSAAAGQRPTLQAARS